MSDWSLPQLTSLYTDVLLNLGGRLDDAAKWNRTGGGTVASAVTLTNPPVGTVRWNSSSGILESNTGTGATPAVPVWEPLATSYGITVAKANQWTTTRTIAATGDATAIATNIDGSANVSLGLTLATVNANVGSFGSAAAVPVFTVNAKGLVTAVSTAALGSMATQASNTVSITGGAISATALTLEQSTTFAQTAEGRIGWDTDDDVITVGTGAATKVFAPLSPTNPVTMVNYTFSTGCTWGGNAIPVANGGTGAADAAMARTNLGVGTMGTQASTAVSITGGAISATAITLVQSTTAAPTAEGRVEWDTDDDVLVVGTSAATKVFAPLSPTNPVTAVNYTFSTGCTWGGNAIPVANGGTGATTASGALSNLGAAAAGQTMYIGTTAVAINRGSAGISLTGVNIDGNAGYASNAGALGGYAASASGGANLIVQRDANGYIANNYFYTSGGGSERNISGLGYFAGFNATDYYVRSYTPAAVAAALSGQTMNINGNATTSSDNVKFMSTSHSGTYWAVMNWDGTYWQQTTNHGSPVRVGYADVAGVANNVTGGSAGAIPYQTGAGTTGMTGVGAAGQVLQSNGAAAPSWVTLAGGLGGMQVFTSTAAGQLFTIPAGVTKVKVTVIGGGGGSYGFDGKYGYSGGSGGTSSFSTYCSATGGAGSTGAATAGGSGSGGTINVSGFTAYPSGASNLPGANAAAGIPMGQYGLGGRYPGVYPGAGGGGGGAAIKFITGLNGNGTTTVPVTVGAGGAGGASGGVAGGSGIVIVEW